MRPLWTMKVWPTKSGVIVLARAQVVIGSRLFSRVMRRTFFSSLGSTKGPFFRLRLMSGASSLLALAHDEARAGLAGIARVAALAGLAPGRAGLAAGAGAALAAAQRVRVGRHGRAAHLGTPVLVPVAPGLADRDQRVVDVADLPDRRAAVDVDLAHLAAGQDHARILALARGQADDAARRAAELGAAAGLELDAVH